MRVPRLCLYFPLILFGSLVAVAYFARPRVSLLRPGRSEAQALKNIFGFFWVFLLTVLILCFTFEYH